MSNPTIRAIELRLLVCQLELLTADAAAAAKTAHACIAGPSDHEQIDLTCDLQRIVVLLRGEHRQAAKLAAQASAQDDAIAARPADLFREQTALPRPRARA